LDPDGCASQVALRAVDLNQKEVKPGLMVITVDGNGLPNTLLFFRQITGMERG
jgi:hypothetical protein